MIEFNTIRFKKVYLFIYNPMRIDTENTKQKGKTFIPFDNEKEEWLVKDKKKIAFQLSMV